MKIQYEVDQVLEKNILVESANQNKSSVTPPLFTAEKNLLLLASYPDCTEGILYSMPLLKSKLPLRSGSSLEVVEPHP